LDNPKTVHLGGQTAAPIFKNTTVRILALTGEPFREGKEEDFSRLAVYQTSNHGLPKEFSTLAPKESSFVLKSEPSLSETLSVPNVLGMTAREAVRVLSAQNLQVKLLGSGLVTKQTLEPCTSSDEKQICVIECSPK
jgi:hypothetical protein